MKITVIDDDKILSNLIKEALEYKDNHNVTVINKASEAIVNMAEILKSDVIILDLMMRRPENLPVGLGEETGEALLRLLRKESKKLPVIAITGKELKDINSSLKSQNIQILMKPLDPHFKELSEAINHAQ